MWCLLLLFIALIEPVNLQGNDKLILNGARPCEGHVKVFHNGVWGFVGDTNWSEGTEDVICRSTQCGTPVKNSKGMVLRPLDSKVWLNELSCTGNESQLWECDSPGWDISQYRADAVKTVNCSNNIKIKMDGFECAGAVTYYTDGETPPGYFCDENWNEDVANLLCKTLECGQHKQILQNPWFGWERFPNSRKMKIKCLDTANLKHLWHCANQETRTCSKPASVICSGFERLQLKGNGSNACAGLLEKEENGKWTAFKNTSRHPNELCKQMHCGREQNKSSSDDGIHLTCSEKVEIVLRNNNEESQCYGVVHVKEENSIQPVCASNWGEKEAEVVCGEKKCGKVIDKRKETYDTEGVMDFVSCSGKESSLWHCWAKRRNNAFKCDSSAYVVCSNSIDVRLVDGPGRCAGRLEIKYEGRWKRVNKAGWTSDNSDTVCQQLKCGKERKPPNPDEKFSQGSAEFLAATVKCTPNAKDISECFTAEQYLPVREQEPVGITCEEHKVFFLEGQNSCSGMVGIEQGSKTYWLSGSNETWNKNLASTVCQKMNCGEAFNHGFTSNSDGTKEFWHKTYDCLSSFLECENTDPPSGYNESIATVTCTGTTKVSLTGGCWGTVNVCIGGTCGGVCNSSWTNEKSKMLCENLKCGHPIVDAKNRLKESNVTINSLHLTNHTKNLNQCNFIKKGDNENPCKAAFVVCSGSVEARMNDSRESCSGNVEMFYEGQWLPVCKEALNNDKETPNIICKELGCGPALQTTDFFGPKPGPLSISQIKCANDITDCNIMSDVTSCTYAGLQCSQYRKMELKFGTPCSGAVFVYSDGKRSAVSVEGWTKTEGNRLCQDLKCGSSGLITETDPKAEFWNKTFSCAAEQSPDSIWACENDQPPNVRRQLFVECQNEPKVTLSETCGGKVKINDIRVCDSHWNIGYSHLVCQEMGCSNAVGNSSSTTASPNVEYQHVMCEEYHSRLGQCKRFKAKCDGKLVSVHCVNHVKFKTTQSCGGQIQVQYRSRWETMCLAVDLSLSMKNQLCEDIKCVRYNASVTKQREDKVSLDSTLNCTSAHRDIKHCVRQKSCDQLKPALIYCYGYVEKPATEVIVEQSLVVPIILGVSFLLAVVIMTFVFVRLYTTWKARRAKNAMLRMSRKEMEYESGDYEDIHNRPSESEDFNHGRFRHEAEFIIGHQPDARSTSSIPYDDIDEAVPETQSLTSRPAKAGPASEAFYISESVLNQSADGVAYEVDDPRENYDDIEAGPEMTQAKAEVHDDPPVRAEGVPVAPAGLLKRDEDYLEPDQDG